MKILFVSAVFPYPLHSGGQVRIYQLLKRLSAKHEITLAAFIRDERERSYVPKLSFLHEVKTILRGSAWQTRYILSSLVSDYPFLYATYKNEEMKRFLRSELARGYDLIHLEPGYVWLSLPETTTPVVVSEHNIEHEVYERFARHMKFSFMKPAVLWDVAKMANWEGRIWNNAAAVTAASETDAAHIRAKIPTGIIDVVSNGVDIDAFPFHPKKRHSHPLTFLYVGTFAWIQNADAASHLVATLWPKIREKYPDAKLRIVGKNPPQQLVRLHPDVQWVQEVEDINEEYHAADILLAPIRIGGGTKYKIIESMAVGLPVITTHMGAEGMPVSHRKEVWIAETPQEVLAAVDDITGGTQTNQILSRARKLVEHSYDWQHIAHTLDAIWKKAHEKRR